MNARIQIIEKDGEPEYAVVPYEDYRRLLELAENAEDIRAGDEARRALAAGEDELLPAEVVDRLLRGDVHPVRVWREYRGMTQEALAGAAGISKSYLSLIESGRKRGSLQVLERIARALRLDLDDILPTAE